MVVTPIPTLLFHKLLQTSERNACAQAESIRLLVVQLRLIAQVAVLQAVFLAVLPEPRAVVVRQVAAVLQLAAA